MRNFSWVYHSDCSECQFVISICLKRPSMWSSYLIFNFLFSACSRNSSLQSNIQFEQWRLKVPLSYTTTQLKITIITRQFCGRKMYRYNNNSPTQAICGSSNIVIDSIVIWPQCGFVNIEKVFFSHAPYRKSHVLVTETIF